MTPADSMIQSISLPLFLIVSLGLLAAATYIVRSWERGVAAVAGVLVAVAGVWMWRLDVVQQASVSLPLAPVRVDLGAELARFGFVLEPNLSSIPILSIYFVLAAVAFLLAAQNSQGRSFISLTLLLLAGYTGLTLITAGPLSPVLLTPILLAMLASGSVFVLQAGRLSYPHGSLRLLLPPVLAFPVFLLAAWHIEQIPLNPQDEVLLATIAQLLSVGMLILLAPFPLHGAHVASAQTAPPLVIALLNLFYELAVLILFHQLLEAHPFIPTAVPLATWLVWAGVLTAVWGGLAALGTTHLGRLWGYASLHDWGLIIIALAMPGVRRWPLVLLLFGMRAVSLLTAAGGLAAVENQTGSLAPERLQGIGSRLPWNSAVYVLGGLGLVGFPLSVGFTGHWAAVQMVAAIDWQLAAAVLLASAGAVFSYIRVVRMLFGPLQNRYQPKEALPSALTAILMLILSVGLALSPQWLNGLINHALIVFQ